MRGRHNRALLTGVRLDREACLVPKCPLTETKVEEAGGEQFAVGFALDLVLALYQPVEGGGDQALDRRVLVVAGDLAVQVPPDAFDRIQFLRVFREEH